MNKGKDAADASGDLDVIRAELEAKIRAELEAKLRSEAAGKAATVGSAAGEGAPAQKSAAETRGQKGAQQAAANVKTKLQAARSGPAAGSGPLVLIACADPDDAETIKSIALDAGCEVEVMATAGGLIAEINRLQPHVVFLDKQLPNLSLVQVCRTAKARNVGVVLAGSFTSRQDVVMAASLGVADFITMPLVPEVIGPKVINALARAKELYNRKIAFQALAADTAGLPAEQKIRKLLDKTQEVMALPQVAAKIIALCGQAETHTDDLTKAAELDPAISGLLLKRANSAAYGSMTPVTNLRGAIVRLGYRTVRSIATLVSVFKLSGATERSFAFSRLGVWVHSLAVGVIAEAMAMRARHPRAEDVFLAGILHDFGKLAFDDHLHEDYAAVFKDSIEKHISLRDAEEEYFHTSHDKVGEEICRRWKLPEPICAAIGLHHEPHKLYGESAKPEAIVAGFVYAADLMTRALTLGNSGDSYAAPLPSAAWEHIGPDAEAVRKFGRSVVERVSELIQWLGMQPERAGIQMPPEPSGKWVCVAAGGKPDRLLDAFFADHGFEVVRPGERAAPESAPAVGVFDLRAEPTVDEAAIKAASLAQRQVVIARPDGREPAGLPQGAARLNSPLDYSMLLQTIS